jgi:hypothetical protein
MVSESEHNDATGGWLINDREWEVLEKNPPSILGRGRTSER